MIIKSAAQMLLSLRDRNMTEHPDCYQHRLYTREVQTALEMTHFTHHTNTFLTD